MRHYRVTLAWYDPANVDGTTKKALLHDLDLKITSPYNEVYVLMSLDL